LLSGHPPMHFNERATARCEYVTAVQGSSAAAKRGQLIERKFCLNCCTGRAA
jgi:hypothetical protein